MPTVLITGIGNQLAQMVAKQLLAQPGVRVIGVDQEPLTDAPPGVETHASELRGAHLRDLVCDTAASAVIHLAQVGEERVVIGHEASVRGNVLTTMELLGACASAGVQRVVLRSSSLVYGARHDQPMFLSEITPLDSRIRSSPIRDYVEIERFAADFAGKFPHLSITLLRCAACVGSAAHSALMRYLHQAAPRTLLGFDPLIQVLHPQDAATAFALAATVDHPGGPFNIAGDPPLPLSQAIRLAGRQPLPLPGPLFDLAGVLGLSARALVGALPVDPMFFQHACTVDTGKAQSQLGFVPQHSPHETLRELAPAIETAEPVATGEV